MFNFDFFIKILEVTDTPVEEAKRTMLTIAQAVNYKFETGFIMYLAEHTDDNQLMEFMKLVSESDNTSLETMDKYMKWVKDNPAINMDKFMENFEKEMHEMELRLLDSLKGKLSEQQKIKLIDFLQDQQQVVDIEVEEIISDLGLLSS